MAALRKLAERILEHARGGPTRIILKRSQKGKYASSEWISSQALSKIDVQGLLDRLLVQTKQRKKYVNLLIKQHFLGGSIHDLVKISETLV